MGAWDRLTTHISQAAHFFNTAASIISGAMSSAYHAVTSRIGSVISFFGSVPGRIRGVLGDLGRLLWNAGVSILSGLLDGLLSKWHAVTNFIGGIAGWIGSHKGPIEVDAVLLKPHGRAIMSGLVGGLQDGMPGLTSQLARTTGAIANTRIPAIAGGAGGAPLRIEWVGGAGADREFMTWLKRNIRISGGDPAVLERGWRPR